MNTLRYKKYVSEYPEENSFRETVATAATTIVMIPFDNKIQRKCKSNCISNAIRPEGGREIQVGKKNEMVKPRTQFPPDRRSVNQSSVLGSSGCRIFSLGASFLMLPLLNIPGNLAYLAILRALDPPCWRGSRGEQLLSDQNLTLSFKLWPTWQRKFGPLSGEFSLVILPTRVAFLTEPQILRPYSYAFGSIKMVISENLFLLDSRTFFPLQYDRQMDTHTFDAGFILIVCIKIGWGLNT